jgi:hypothetical protein
VQYVNLFHARFNQLGSSRANIQGGVVMSRDRNRQANDEPSLAMSFGLLCVVLFAMFAIVANVNIPDVQFVQTNFLADL